MAKMKSFTVQQPLRLQTHKGNYYINCNLSYYNLTDTEKKLLGVLDVSENCDCIDGRYNIARKVKGYLFSVDGIDFGVRKEGWEWSLTEISTGCRVGEEISKNDVITKLVPKRIDSLKKLLENLDEKKLITQEMKDFADKVAEIELENNTEEVS